MAAEGTCDRSDGDSSKGTKYEWSVSNWPNRLFSLYRTDYSSSFPLSIISLAYPQGSTSTSLHIIHCHAPTSQQTNKHRSVLPLKAGDSNWAGAQCASSVVFLLERNNKDNKLSLSRMNSKHSFIFPAFLDLSQMNQKLYECKKRISLQNAASMFPTVSNKTTLRDLWSFFLVTCWVRNLLEQALHQSQRGLSLSYTADLTAAFVLACSTFFFGLLQILFVLERLNMTKLVPLTAEGTCLTNLHRFISTV